MKLPLSWLKEYVEWNVTPEEFVERMMWRGFETAGILEEIPALLWGVLMHLQSIPMQISCRSAPSMWVGKRRFAS